jgi:hypothetical protein
MREKQFLVGETLADETWTTPQNAQPYGKRTHYFIVTSYTTQEHILEHDEELLQVTCAPVECTRAGQLLLMEGSI